MNEIDVEKTSAEAKEIATAASKPGKFSLIDRLADRDYPTEEVEVYLDEAAGYEIEKYTEELSNTKNDARANFLGAKIEKAKEKAAQSKITLTLQGISNDTYDRIVEDAQEQFPLEYREDRHPLTMKLERELIPNEDRETYFRTHLWAAYITKATDPEGNVDEEIDAAWVAYFLKKAPLNAIGKVYVGVEKLRMVTDWMDNIQTDDFLAKS